MSANPPTDIEEVLAITDPGEVNRDTHTTLDRFVVHFSNVIAWAFPVLMIAIVSQVFLRGAGHNQAWLDDLQWWIYGAAMLVGMAYAITTNSHVRVDIIHQNFTRPKKARIETFALGWMLMPFLVIMTDMMIPYAISSVVAGEGSSSPNGLHRVYYLKIAIPIIFAVGLIAAWAAFRRNLAIASADLWWRRLFWAFPTIVLIVWRLVHYATYWFVRLTNEDINARRITREPVFEYLLPAAAAIVAIAVVLTWLARDKTQAAGDH